MLFAFVAVGFCLFLYRELPDMVRKRLYNDPVPLVVSDRGKIQIRQIPYAPSGHFLYRLYLPSDRGFELCVAQANSDETLPLPKQVHQLGPFNNTGGEEIEWRISGARFNVDPAKQEQRLDVKVERIQGPMRLTQSPLTISFPALGTYKQIVQIHRPGAKSTETLDPDESVLLYRELWSDDPTWPASMQDSIPPGLGIVVWIRPTAPKQESKPH